MAVSLMLVTVSYASLTLYDLLALRTIRRADIPYRIAALASFTSYPIAHGVGAVALIAPVIRYRVYSRHGLGVFDVANISFLTGLTFWLGNLTALALSLLCAPDAISLINYLPPSGNRWLAAALLLGVFAFLLWTWLAPRSFGTLRWPVRLPSGPVVLLQIAIGIFDLGAAALAMYVLSRPGWISEFSRDRGVHRRDIAGLCQPHAGGDRRLRRRDIDRAGRRGKGAGDRGAVDVPVPVPLPSVRARARPVRRPRRVEEFARQEGAVKASSHFTPAS